MHDIRAIRDNPDAFDAALARRGLSGLSAEILALDEARRTAIRQAEEAKAAINVLSKDAGAAKAKGDEAAFQALRGRVADSKAAAEAFAAQAAALDMQLRDTLLTIPNLPHPDVPDGADEGGNVEVRRWGSPRDFAFAPREHFDIAGVKPGMDFETAAKLSGSRFVVLKGAVIRLHRALAQFMLDTHITEHGLTEVWTPVLVKEEAMVGTNQLPKFAEDSYQTTNGWWLIPTSEVTLTNTVAGEVLEAAQLPVRMTAHTQCFRSEAGSAGRDTAGMLRQHQFEKVEMVSITTPETSLAEHDRMTRCAEAILEKLGLPYRTVLLCAGDMGFGAQKTHDLEVWLPGQNTYREISSVSVCGDFQARRMNARYRAAGGKPEFVHTLNGSGLAVGRTLIAVLENGQQEDGSVDLPPVLGPYLGGKTRIAPDGTLQ
ncbi:MAG: serine--tRNA ligase [Rhodobacter sp.]|nr:serine--tRNA ligase [Rhodobacter sp.]MCA3493954.1 serine--tRNA ligase [Rhodobacter sp.]MCA3499219.1 serine--tRNA ligase [Rhodobacter sp.]MCA3503096.1 serine--tRNA ligase [Rhodobacter sp.]MCA3516472.1 serine--tRNA ligase [Rhodobacter sp.]